MKQTRRGGLRSFAQRVCLTLLVLACAPAVLVRCGELDHGQWIMYRDPKLPVPGTVVRFPPGLVELWQQALERPEREMKRRAAVAIAEAYGLGLEGLEATIPQLTDLVEDPQEDRAVKLSAAAALVALDAEQSTDALFETLEPTDVDMASRVEPALARWGYGPAETMWRERLRQDVSLRRMHVLAVRGLAECGVVEALPRLQELALDERAMSAIRLEAAAAVGRLRDSGCGEIAARVLERKGRTPLLQRLVAVRILTRDQSEKARQVLTELATTAEPVVQTPALQHLMAIDPQLVAQLQDQLLASEDVKLRRLGCDALLATMSENTPEHVVALAPLLNDPNPSLRVFIRESLHELTNIAALRDRVISETLKVLQGDNWRGQEQATRLLVALDQKAIVDRLVVLLQSPRKEVLVTAAWGLSELQVESTCEPMTAVFQEKTDRLLARDSLPPGTDQQLALLAQALGRMEHFPAIPAFKTYVPKGTTLPFLTRAAAVWAIGKILAGKPDQELVDQLIGRMTDVASQVPEEPLVRRMAAVSLGRMGEPRSLSSLRRMAQRGGAVVDTGIACYWAIEQITGEPLPDIQPNVVRENNWFLVPAASTPSSPATGEENAD